MFASLVSIAVHVIRCQMKRTVD